MPEVSKLHFLLPQMHAEQVCSKNATTKLSPNTRYVSVAWKSLSRHEQTCVSTCSPTRSPVRPTAGGRQTLGSGHLVLGP